MFIIISQTFSHIEQSHNFDQHNKINFKYSEIQFALLSFVMFKGSFALGDNDDDKIDSMMTLS